MADDSVAPLRWRVPGKPPAAGGMNPIEKRARPPWLKVRLPGGERYSAVKSIIRQNGLHTVCEDARCPNLGECWGAGTATFMILGDICTRACGFCAVQSGRPQSHDLEEPSRVAAAISELGLRYAVITSVDRDDLDDGGASIFAETIRQIRLHCRQTRVEVLIPDFKGSRTSLGCVADAGPDVLAHNIETVPRLYPVARAGSRYARSLELLRKSREIDSTLVTKSSLMLGLGESVEEVVDVLVDLRASQVEIVTLGQYLQPTRQHLPVQRFYSPLEFKQLQVRAEGMGFRHVESGPLVRSSYLAERQFCS